MNLFLRAFGQSEEYTLKERANLIIDLHQKVSSILDKYEWKLLARKQTILIDIRNRDDSYPSILQQVKKGLNAKVVKIIRYKEDDVADTSSTCYFYSKTFSECFFHYLIGYPTEGNPPAMMTAIDNICDTKLFTREVIRQLSIEFIRAWKPETLCVTDPDFFHDISRPFDKNIPWTGWVTYLSDSLLKRNNKDILSVYEFLKTKGENFIKDIEVIEGRGLLIWTCREPFNPNNADHLQAALALEKYFVKNKIYAT